MPRTRKLTKDELLEIRHAIREDAEAGRLAWPDGIRRMRKAMGMTQAEFARRFKLTVRQLSELELGTANPTVKTLGRIARIYGLEVGLVPAKAEGARIATAGSPG